MDVCVGRREEFLGRGIEPFSAYIRWVADDGIESSRACLDLILMLDPLVGVDEVEEGFGKLDLSMEKTPVGPAGQRLDLGDQFPLLFVSKRGVEFLWIA
jgi:hypothetical protein